jgi:hypothetical protein
MKKKATENKVVIKEILSICEDLGVKINSQTPAEKNKFLSAWNKASTDIN